MIDLAEQKKIEFDLETLSVLTGSPIVTTSGRSGLGIDSIKEKIAEFSKNTHEYDRNIQITYARDIEEAIENLVKEIDTSKIDSSVDKRWLAIKILENESASEEIYNNLKNADKLFAIADTYSKKLTKRYNSNIRQLMTNWRYGFINGLLKETRTQSEAEDILSNSRKIDKILTNRYLGLPIFFFFLWATFKLTFDLGRYPMDIIDKGVTLLARLFTMIIPEGILQELVVDGIISGVGGIAVFLPNIFILFFIISIMEDSGYMARAAFIMDRIMHSIGLHGKAFIPMVMGFGCNVPAIVGTRILESERDRILSIMINPLISCSARLPVYIMLTGAFFPNNGATIILSIYTTGILLAILIGKLFSVTILKGNSLPFVMELPPYLPPSLRSLLLHTWERGSLFIRKMGSVILLGSVLIWSLSAFPRDIEYSQDWQNQIIILTETENKQALFLENNYQKEYEKIKFSFTENDLITESLSLRNKYFKLHDELSIDISDQKQIIRNLEHSDIISRRYLGQIGKVFEPFLAPIGIDWQGSVGLIVGFIAKEFVVSTYGILMGFGNNENEHSAGIINQLRKSAMTPLTAFVFMIFTLIYTPCLATLATIKQETNSWKWTFFSLTYSLILAWTLSFLIYRTGIFLGIGV